MARKRNPNNSRQPVDLSAEDAAFRRAMEVLASVPDKDRDSAAEVRSAAKKALNGKLRRPKHGEIQETLDLHGKNTERALRDLDSFIQRTRAAGRRSVRVITGKGLRSEGGTPVLKKAVERWLRRSGADRVARVEPAPRHLGGGGALILFLRPRRSPRQGPRRSTR